MIWSFAESHHAKRNQNILETSLTFPFLQKHLLCELWLLEFNTSFFLDL